MKIIRINAMWCSGCLYMNTVWQKIMKEYPNLEVVEYDYDMDEDKVAAFAVGDVLPVAIFFVGDTEVERICGETKVERIKELIMKYED